MVRPYDTRRRQVVPIQPARRGELRVYACGPTVYRAGMSVQSAPQGPWSPATPTTPYGNAVSADESGLGQPNIIRYTGGALGQTTSLTKLGQRYYNPALGAFTQQDTIALLASPQNGNLYAYAGDNPASLIDPTGHQGQDTCSEVPTLYECYSPPIDTIIVLPVARFMRERPDDAVLDALAAASARRSRIVSLCLGAFVLAAAGLLDGRRATTHWPYCQALGEAYPQVEVVPDVLYIDEGDVLTSGGVAAGIDLCLHLVRKDHGDR